MGEGEHINIKKTPRKSYFHIKNTLCKNYVPMKESVVSHRPAKLNCTK